MTPIVHLNGQWIPADRAAVSVQDRGFLFADGVYEVVRYYRGRGFELAAHVERLRSSLAAIRIEPPDLADRMGALSDELMQRNQLPDGVAYWQVTRGVAPRKHTFPPPGAPPTILLMAYPAAPFDPAEPLTTLRAITRPDLRWHHCHIKSIALLPNVLDAQVAHEHGCEEAILHRDGVVTEGTHRSILFVEGGENSGAKGGVVRTYPLDGRILDSITRRVVLDLARRDAITVVEQPWPLDRLHDADEVIAVGSTTEVAAITHIDDRPIAHGTPGPVTHRLHHLYRKHIIQSCAL